MPAGSATELTYSEICKLVETEADSKLVGAVDRLLGAVLLMSPAVTGNIGLWGLIGPKNELVRLTRSVITKLTKQRDSDFISQHRRMAVVHTLTCYSAFFQALDKALEASRRVLDISEGETAAAATAAISSVRKEFGEDSLATTAAVAGGAVELPHPVSSLDEKTAQLGALYAELTAGFRNYVIGRDEWETAGDRARARFEKLLDAVPQNALATYEAQYFRLATKYPEFLVWANLHEHAETDKRLARMSAYVREQVALTRDASARIDLGMARLADAAARLRIDIGAEQAKKVTTALDRCYRSAVEARIIDDPFEGQDGAPALRYPKKAEIFVPQAFKVLRAAAPTGAPVRLEDEGAWAAVDARDALGPFLLSYLSSPYSTETPLILLGHPGSGKSLLTEILAARLAVPGFNPIRVELRNIDADGELQTQIEQQIRRDTGRDVDWVVLAEDLNAAPPLVILDGFDELLQASGQVHANYLDKVQQFQRREAVQGRPVRVLVTSRITLIDKAHVPPGSTVIRLEDFDASRRERWISVWNGQNQNFFKESGTKPFQVPSQQSEVSELARQPLLLLMLALFDSDGNQLRTSRQLDQTLLYHSLQRVH